MIWSEISCKRTKISNGIVSALTDNKLVGPLTKCILSPCACSCQFKKKGGGGGCRSQELAALDLFAGDQGVWINKVLLYLWDFWYALISSVLYYLSPNIL